MWNSLRSLLCGSMLCCALGATTADASISRTQFFTFACNGQQQAVTFAIGQLGNNVTRFIQGAEISLTAASPNLQFILLQAAQPGTLLQMGPGDVHVARDYTGFFQVLTDPVGNVLISVAGLCSGGGNISGFVTINIFS